VPNASAEKESAGVGDAEIERLFEIETQAKRTYESKAAELEQKRARRNKYESGDTPAFLIKLSTEIIELEAIVDVAKGKYDLAVAARIGAENKLALEYRRTLRAELLSTASAHVREGDERYSKLALLLKRFMDERAACAAGIREWNEALREDEQPIVDPFEEMRCSAATPDVITNTLVDGQRSTGNFKKGYPVYETVKVPHRAVLPGRPRINPTPLHEAFELPGLLPDDPNFRAEGTTRPDSIQDVCGGSYSFRY